MSRSKSSYIDKENKQDLGVEINKRRGRPRKDQERLQFEMLHKQNSTNKKNEHNR
jgi:hypothetical protein